jgi:phage terminase Nu1 subunit (DNA packaging protein)
LLKKVETKQTIAIENLLTLGPRATAKAYQDILTKIKNGLILSPAEVKSLSLLEAKLRGGAAEQNQEAPLVTSLEEVARHFGKVPRTVRRWINAGMPRLSNGSFDLGQIALWLGKKQGKSGGEVADGEAPAGGEGCGKDYEDMRAKRAQADLRELQLRKLRGELIELAELEALLTPRAMAYRQGLIGFRQILAPRLAAALKLPPESMRVMNAIIDQAAREILANVLRPLTLSGGQVLEWEANRGEV